MGFFWSVTVLSYTTQQTYSRFNYYYTLDLIWLLSTFFTLFVFICILCLSLPLAIYTGYLENEKNLIQFINYFIPKKWRHFLEQKETMTTDDTTSTSISKKQNQIRQIKSTDNLETDEDAYYEAFAKNMRNIRSISHYMGKTIHKKNWNRAAAGARALAKYRIYKKAMARLPIQTLYNQPIQTALPSPPPPPPSPPPQPLQPPAVQKRQQSPNKARRLSSSGENYYAAIMKYANIRSVSQYK